MAPYGRISHHIWAALDILTHHQPTTELEEHHAKLARFHLLAALKSVRFIHHTVRWWR